MKRKILFNAGDYLVERFNLRLAAFGERYSFDKFKALEAIGKLDLIQSLERTCDLIRKQSRRMANSESVYLRQLKN